MARPGPPPARRVTALADATILLWLALPLGFALSALVGYMAPGLVRRHDRGYRRVVVAASAVAAASAGAEPTGLRWWDMALAAALVAAATSLAARARLQVLTVAALIAAVVGLGSDGHTIGLLTLGVAVATVLTARRAPAITPLVALGLVQAALRLDLPGPQGTSALAAAAVLVPPAYVGCKAMRRNDRKKWTRAAAATGAVAVAAASLAAIAFATARPALERGVDEAERALTAVRAADQETAATTFERAEGSFASAERSLGAVWTRPAWLLPVIGPHLRALDAVAASGHDLAGGGVRVAGAADLGDLQITDGTVPLDEVRRLEPELADAAVIVTQARARLARTRSAWLLPPVGRRLATQVERLDEVEGTLANSRDVLRILPGLLGADGPRRYFLAVQTPSELRGSGGFFGNFGEIVADNGKLTLARFGRLRELNGGGDPANRTLTGPPDYLARYERFAVATTWQNVTMSPDWPSVTEVIAGLYPQSGGAEIDGAIAVDPAGMAALLELTGPLTVPGWPEPVGAGNAERILLHDQYVELADDDRVDFLGDSAELLFDRLTTGALPKPSTILSALGPAVARKHLQLASLHDDEQEVLTRLDVAGAMAPVNGDFLALVAQNASPSKIDWFLHRRLAYDVDIDETTGELAATVTATLRNDAPASGLPPVIIGNAHDLPMGTSRLYVSIYSPWALTGARIGGRPVTVESERERDRNVYSTYVDIPPGAEVTIELDLAGWYDGHYRLDVHRQPTAHPDALEVVVDGRPLFDDGHRTDLALERSFDQRRYQPAQW